VTEALLKIIAYGFLSTERAYLKNGWNQLDFAIVLVSVTVIAAGEVGLLKASDGLPLPEGQIYAPVWPDAAFVLPTIVFLILVVDP
jgi:hypothetical protein